MCRLICLILLLCATLASASQPIYLWHEPEWFTGVEGSAAYWPGPSKPTGKWGIAGPGISAEWGQGGESEWNSLGASAGETSARCHRDLIIPRAGTYRVWVRYVDHRKAQAPFKVVVEAAGKLAGSTEMGVRPIVPINDEYMLYWGFSFGWSSFDVELPAGKARISLIIDRAGEARRQVDALLVTSDLTYEPVGREKPPFAYLQAMQIQPAAGSVWRGTGLPAVAFKRAKVGGRDFSMWTGVDASDKWWKAQKLDTLELVDVFHALSSPPDIRKPFLEQYPRPKETPLINDPNLLPGFYLGVSPDLSEGTALRRWLERTRTPFYILTNYATPRYNEKNGPATFAALQGPLAKQFLGYIHGEAVGTGGVDIPREPLGKTRAEQLAGLAEHLRTAQAKAWSGMYRTEVPADHRKKSIPCLSVESVPLAHFFHESGSSVVGYEEDSTNYHVPMRIAFQRGAARQYGGAWINYASGNFGDACNYFTQDPRVPRGAKGWWHSKYAITDGVTAVWYRKMYYLNYLSGASAIYWEQSLENQWLLPGPGTHKIQLSPFGRGTEDFMAFTGRLGDRGEPITPVAFLLNYAHGYEPVNYRCKMLDHFPLSPADLELRELFNVAWYPSALLEGMPAAPDVQSLPSGKYGNIFDVLVDRPARARAIFSYPVLWAAGDVDLGGAWPDLLRHYVEQGGTLVVNIEACRTLPASLLGLSPTGKNSIQETWTPAGGKEQRAVPFELAEVKLSGAKPLATAGKELPLFTRHAVGKGAVIVSLVPRLLGQDERAHPALGYLMNGITQGLLPIEVLRADGKPVGGEILYQVNRTRDGYLVLLMNNHGVDKTQSGLARVDRKQWVDVIVRTREPMKTAQEMTTDRKLTLSKGDVHLRVHPGDVQVVQMSR